MSHNYKRLVVWQRAHALAIAVYQFTHAFPENERYGLTSQLRRAATSVPANISEGSGRNSSRDFLRFLYTSRGSLKETEYFALLAAELGYTEHAETLTEQINKTFAALHGLIESVEKSLARKKSKS